VLIRGPPLGLPTAQLAVPLRRLASGLLYRTARFEGAQSELEVKVRASLGAKVRARGQGRAVARGRQAVESVNDTSRGCHHFVMLVALAGRP